jgi:hypothetical protein
MLLYNMQVEVNWPRETEVRDRNRYDHVDFLVVPWTPNWELRLNIADD